MLVYYGIANAAALTQPRRTGAGHACRTCSGLAGRLTLAATLPVDAVIAGLVMFAVGLIGRALGR